VSHFYFLLQYDGRLHAYVQHLEAFSGRSSKDTIYVSQHQIGSQYDFFTMGIAIVWCMQVVGLVETSSLDTQNAQFPKISIKRLER
jgi:hypothetical protein